jgi:FAD/FMN-containing dehydrogenase
MMLLNILDELRKKLPWQAFIDAMVKKGFQFTKSLTMTEKNLLNSGKIIIIDNYISSGTIRDPSLLSLKPHVIFRPRNEDQLRDFVIQSQRFKIPITFASGKTGLSGGFANFGALVDLEAMHSDSKQVVLDLSKKKVYAEQSTLVSDLIKVVNFKSKGRYIFPVQPASSLKLPVRVGGLIASNASGITSGKLGAAIEWIIDMRIMLPNGKINKIDRNDSLFEKIVGGNGFYGIVLSANFRLYQPDSNLEEAILFGDDLTSAFNGLQKVLDAKIFPLVSEFVTSPIKLPGEFGKLAPSNKHSKEFKVNWAVLIKGRKNMVKNFIKIMINESACFWTKLTEEEYQKYMHERSSFAILVQTSEDDTNHIAFPGFEDILSQPKFLPDIIDTINSIFTKNGFHKVIFGYGHINFRRGKGLLLHMRLPVPIHYFYRENSEKLFQICKTVYEVIITLKKEFQIQYKAEHSSGPFEIWLNTQFRESLEEDVNQGYAFYNPHLMIYNHLKKELKGNSSGDNYEELFISSLLVYLS